LGQAGIFVSRYPCGKRYGFHFDGLYEYCAAELKSTAFSDKFTAVSHIAGLNTLFKIRRYTYHRPREAAVLIGPAFRYRFLYQAPDMTPTEESPGFNAGFHLSLWYRIVQFERKTGIFIRPGIDWYFLTSHQMPSIRTAPLNVFLQVAWCFWSNQ
jgi:hypothetical protein